VITLVAALLLLAPPGLPPVAPEPTPPAETPLERALLCWAALDAECAEAALVIVRADLAALPPVDRVAALALSAEVALSADRGQAAREHLRAALELDPALAPVWPDAWLAVLAEVRRMLPDRLPPTLRIELPAPLVPKRAARVHVHASDPSGVGRVVVRVAGRELVCATTDGELWQTELPRDIVKLPDVILETVAADRLGNEASRVDVVPVAPPAPRPGEATPPLTSRWWFWTAIGVGVAAIATTIVLVTTGDEAPSTSPSSGTIVLEVDVDPEPFR